MAERRMTLEHLLDPVDLPTFFETYWERNSLHIPGRPDKFAALFSVERFHRAVEQVNNTRGERRPDELVYLSAGKEAPDGFHYDIPIRPTQIRPLLAIGLTIQAERLEFADPGLRDLVRAIRAQVRIPSEVDVGAFLSPDGSGFELHYDVPAMWILQIDGAKRWWYSPRPVARFPLASRITTPNERRQGVDGLYREEDLVERVLQTGDVLYLPGGTWHRARGVGRSLHLSLMVRSSNYLQLFGAALAPLLTSLEDWRHLPAPPATPGDLERPGPGLEAQFDERLRELREAVAALTPADLFRAWRSRARAG
jgi:ribosomal protein L16 Arg81 hydroxylase